MKVVAQQTEVNYPNVLLQFFFYVNLQFARLQGRLHDDGRAQRHGRQRSPAYFPLAEPASSSRIQNPLRPSSSTRTACSSL